MTYVSMVRWQADLYLLREDGALFKMVKDHVTQTDVLIFVMMLPNEPR